MEGEMEIQNHKNGAANPHHVITVVTEASATTSDLSSIRQQQFGRSRPTRLKHSAGKSSCCIFRVPRRLVGSHPKAYKPNIVSIGPYHHGRKCDIKMIEEHKPRYFSKLVARTRDQGVSFDDYFNALSLKEREIRDSYSQPLEYKSSDLIDMMLLDGCFIIEVFRMIAKEIDPDRDDPLFNMRWVFTFLTQDFLLLENQIPFFVLETLYDLSKTPEKSQLSLISLALRFFNCTVQWRQQELEEMEKSKCIFSNTKHLLHLLQLTYTYSLTAPRLNDAEMDDNNLELIQSAKKLDYAGIEFKLAESSKKLLDIQFDKGVLLIPPLTMDDFLGCFFLNCIIFEQCYCHTNDHMSTYVKFMECLLRTASDSSFLSDCKILENYCGNDAEVASLFNDLGKDLGFDIGNCYLAREFIGVNEYYQNKWRVRCARIKRKYFGAPWSIISLVAAFVALALTVIQTFMALYSYFLPPP